MTRLSKVILFAAVFSVLGAGCAKPETPPPAPAPAAVPTPSPVAPPPAPSVAPGTSTTPEPAPAPAVTSTISLPTIDETWKTYTNAAVGFSFQWPTRGRYAPEWEVKFVKEGDAHVDDGCYLTEDYPRRAQDEYQLEAGGVRFCHTRYHDAGAGQVYYVDYYLGKVKNTWVLLTFTKRLANGSMFDDPKCHNQTVVAYGTTCYPYGEIEHVAHLDQIVGTFKLTE
jgi:hypothetical protein